MSTDEFGDLADDEYGGSESVEPPGALLAPDHLRVVGLITSIGEEGDERSIAVALDPVAAAPGDKISIAINGKDAAVLVETPPPEISAQRYREKAEEIVECMVNCDLNEEESIKYVASILQDIMEKGL